MTFKVVRTLDKLEQSTRMRHKFLPPAPRPHRLHPSSPRPSSLHESCPDAECWCSHTWPVTFVTWQPLSRDVLSWPSGPNCDVPTRWVLLEWSQCRSNSLLPTLRRLFCAQPIDASPLRSARQRSFKWRINQTLKLASVPAHTANI